MRINCEGMPLATSLVISDRPRAGRVRAGTEECEPRTMGQQTKSFADMDEAPEELYLWLPKHSGRFLIDFTLRRDNASTETEWVQVTRKMDAASAGSLHVVFPPLESRSVSW